MPPGSGGKKSFDIPVAVVIMIYNCEFMGIVLNFCNKRQCFAPNDGFIQTILTHTVWRRMPMIDTGG